MRGGKEIERGVGETNGVERKHPYWEIINEMLVSHLAFDLFR